MRFLLWGATVFLGCSPSTSGVGSGTEADAGLRACTPADAPPDPFEFWALNEVADGGVQCITLMTGKRDVACSGPAQADSSDGGLTLSFADGSRLSWIGNRGSRPLLGASVEAEVVDHQQYGAVGWTEWRHRIVLRDPGSGVILFAAAGSTLPEVPGDAMVVSIFGAPVRSSPTACRGRAEDFCATYEQTFFDVEVDTDPPQLLLSGQQVEVWVTSGRWQVRWSREEHRALTARGADCAPVKSGSAYMFSRVGP